MLTHPESTMRVLRMLLHLTSGHVTLLPRKFQPPELTLRLDLGRRADSSWALPKFLVVYLFLLFQFMNQHNGA